MVSGIGSGIVEAFIGVGIIIAVIIGVIVWLVTYFMMSNSEVIVDKPLQPKMIIQTVEVDGIKVSDTTYVYKIK